MPVARFQMPDGRIGRFEVPEGTTPEAAQSLIEQHLAGQQPAEEPNIFQRIGQDYDKRVGMAQDLANQGMEGKQTMLETIPEMIGTGAGGLVKDVGNEIFQAIAPYIQQGLKGLAPAQYESVASGIDSLKNSYVGKTMQEGVQQAGELYRETPQRFQNAVDALGNVIGAATVVNPATLRGATVAGDAVANAGKAGLSAAKNSSLVQGITARSADTLEHATDAMRAASTALYQAGKQAGAIYTPQVTQDIVSRVNRAVTGTGKLNSTRHADTISALDDLNKEAQAGSLSLEEFDLHRQNLNEVIMDNTDAVTGRLNSDAHRALMARNALDDAIDTFKDQRHLVGGNIQAVDMLNQGRAQWQKASKFERVSNIVAKAGGDPNKIKAGFHRFVSNKKNLKGFTPEEIAVIKAAANNTMTEKIMKGLGRFGIAPENVYLPMVGAGLGTMAGSGGAAGGAIAVGTAARQAGKYVARGKAEKALKVIEK